ncbi:MAG: WecB/TagA/CpsF family glycosyltransferase [Planctomycetaceae bacterium]|nr:WecB/TagA/CpsF family glycosyltransferase [Planctomycetaceae bacterium]
MTTRVKLFGIEIDPLRQHEAVARLIEWIDEPASEGCRYVVTPNVDHTRLLRDNAALRDAYAEADMVLADGMPVVLASRLLRKPLPERVTGADLVPALFDAASESRPLTAYLLGAGPGVAERAARNIEAKWPAVKVVGTYSPPLGFEKDEAENMSILQRIAECRPDVLVVGLGAPKQELWVHRHRRQIAARTAYCVGATIDFLAGEKSRAPRWMQRSGLEWIHRVATEPRRLFGRYAHDAWVFPQLVFREWRTGSGLTAPHS